MKKTGFPGNALLIWAAQAAETAIRVLRRKNRPASAAAPVSGITAFCGERNPKKNALLSLSPVAWEAALRQAPNIQIFNVVGLTFEITKALNEAGYSVDIADAADANFEVRKAYDLYLGHGGRTGRILGDLSPETFVIHYASGAYWEAFNRMSQERYDNFSMRRHLPPIRRFVRSLQGTEQGEEQLARRADAAFVSGPRTVATFAGISRNMSLLYLGSYVQKDLIPRDRNFELGATNFLYAGGTGGNIQKGLDLIIEAFSRLTHLNLFIYCKVEKEVLDAYRAELALPNIHYIYHYSIGPLRSKMRALLARINFTIGAPIDTGPGTAMLGTFGLGMIPVGYIDIDGTNEDSVLIDDFSIESIMDCVVRASRKPAPWFRAASLATTQRFERLHEPSVFGMNFKSYLQKLGL